MPPLGPFDYLLLLITAVLIFELVNEGRRKRWGAMALSGLFLVLVLWMTSPIYVALWKYVTGRP